MLVSWTSTTPFFLLFVLFPEQAEQKSSLRLLKLPTVLKSLHGK